MKEKLKYKKGKFPFAFFFSVGQFASGLSSWYSEYAAWSFALLDHAVTGGADEFMRAAFECPTVSPLVEFNFPEDFSY